MLELIKKNKQHVLRRDKKGNNNNKNTIDSNSACSTEAFILLRGELK